MRLHGFSICVGQTSTITLVRRGSYMRHSCSHPWIAVFFSYAVITTESALLFVQEDQFTRDIHETLGTVVQVRPYNTFFDYLHTLPSTLELNETSVTSS